MDILLQIFFTKKNDAWKSFWDKTRNFIDKEIFEELIKKICVCVFICFERGIYRGWRNAKGLWFWKSKWITVLDPQ